ncbi:uroporphyrinogen decarboxylase family protein [Vallitalea guaymasensis]|uniref:uroporphyrinogen decarboxylase family protein n=1 Tax=Vallitalea guaymasensis TaxID=1185412 RepID=UPI002356B85F|nr:uroporphyrinogen decarboxylase family protein [Vallitalea guaymasensis]
MTKRERVYRAIAHKEADRVPKGELYIDPSLANSLLKKDYPLDYFHFQRDIEVRELLGIDMINLGDWPTEELGEDEEGNKIYRSNYGEEYIFNDKSKHIIKPGLMNIEDAENYPIPDITKCSGKLIKRFAEETDLFVFAQIGGPISMINEMLGMEDYMIYTMTNTKEIRILAEKIMEYEIAKAKLFIDNGANAILIADDMAYNTSTFLPLHIMDEVAFPYYKIAVEEIKKHKDVPVFLHTDGNINNVLGKITDCGFDGLQSLQPSAGMEIEQVKKDFGKDLCLMGNIDLDYVMTFGSVQEVEETIKRTIDIAASGGGFILSTCNILVDVIPPENALAMYNTAHNYGIYTR